MDVRAVKAAGDKAVDMVPRRARARIILEMLTYRYRGHSMSDPAKYRTRKRSRRCAPSTIRSSRCAARLLEKKWASEDELKKIDAEVRDDRQRGGRVRHQRSRARSVRALHRHLRAERWRADRRPFSRISRRRRDREWIAARLCARVGRERRDRWCDRRWLFASASKARRRARRQVNKAMVAFIACVMVAVAAIWLDQSPPIPRSRVRPCRSKS